MQRELVGSWQLHHAVIWLLPAAMLVYLRGFWRVHGQMPQRYPPWRLASFAGGMSVVFLAVASPLDALGERLLHLHMTQHLLLMMVAPPLIWLGQPVVPMLRAFPPRFARRAFRWLLTARTARGIGRGLTHPVVCWTALAVTIVVWHIPRFYELALASDGWHGLQHACFFGAALLFWWPVVGVWPSRARWPAWTMIPYLVAADLVNTALSAILVFSGRILYPAYESVPRVMNLSVLDDQALAGVLMWVPGSIAFLLPAVVLTIKLFEPRSAMQRSQSSVLWLPPSGGRPAAVTRLPPEGGSHADRSFHRP
jgi:cytochrome c oxidase assembly factor CtaG